MNKIVTITIIFILQLLTVSFVTAETLTICGTGDSQKLLRELAMAYEKIHPGTTIAVPDSIGSSGGIKATAAGKCDMGRIARPLKEKEKNYNLQYLQFALSPVVMLANKSVEQVKGLSTEQIIDIYSGRIRFWSQLNGPDEKIYVVNREKGDSSRSVLEEKLAGFTEIIEPVGQTVYSTPETIEAIGKYSYTIGYSTLSQSVTNSNIFILQLDGIDPTPENIASGIYKLSSPYGLVWKKEAKERIQGFLKFLYTEKAREICRTNGTVITLSRTEK